jgi:putative ABC transport system permease protein
LKRRDLLDEALAGITARPARLGLTALGTVLGVAALVATLGLAQTAAAQVVGRFDAVAATHVVVEPRTTAGPEAATSAAPPPVPWDAEDRLARLNGVVAAGTYAPVTDGTAVTTVPVADPSGAARHDLAVVAASPGLIDALRGRVVTGRLFDAGHDQRADPVALLGERAADRLHLNRVTAQPTVFVGDTELTVIGIVGGVSHHIDLLDAVIVPNHTAARLFGLPGPTEVQIRTALGAVQVIGRQAPIALVPNEPETLQARVPPSVARVQARVEADVNALFLVLGGVALLVGALGIVNVTLLSVLERVAEIGLRRALGATRGDVAAQFLVESSAVGLLGGLVGTAAGVVLTVAVSAARDWTPVLDLRLAAGAPVLGAVIGLAAGTYPAWRASAVHPIDALRSAG